MSNPTQHGQNIAGQIQGEDAFGQFDPLTPADVWLILDNLQTHFMDSEMVAPVDMAELIGKWMQELESADDDLPVI